MSFKQKSTVIYAVRSSPPRRDERDLGHVSVRTDRKKKSGEWAITSAAVKRALSNGGFLSGHHGDVFVDGNDDGVMFVHDERTDQPLLQLEYERHHHIDEKPKGLFGSESRPNPLGGMSTAQIVGWSAVGVTVVGLVGWYLYSKAQASAAAAQVAAYQQQGIQANAANQALSTYQSGSVDQQPPFVPGFVPGQ